MATLSVCFTLWTQNSGELPTCLSQAPPSLSVQTHWAWALSDSEVSQAGNGGGLHSPESLRKRFSLEFSLS